MENNSVNQLRVGTDSKLTQDLRYLLGDSRLAELHDQYYNQPIFQSVCSPAVFESKTLYGIQIYVQKPAKWRESKFEWSNKAIAGCGSNAVIRVFPPRVRSPETLNIEGLGKTSLFPLEPVIKCLLLP